MGKKQKRGKAGNAVQYMTRNQAIKKLQLRLSEFRCDHSSQQQQQHQQPNSNKPPCELPIRMCYFPKQSNFYIHMLGVIVLCPAWVAGQSSASRSNSVTQLQQQQQQCVFLDISAA